MSFEDLGLSQQLLSAVGRMNLKVPTQIQEKTIPLIMQGRDVIGESATGSGKTLAFGSGIVEKVVPGNGLQALVLTPTRELAEQVTNSLKKMSYKKPLKIISIYGGVSINPQIFQLSKCDVVVGTPGRLLDHLERRTINTSKVKILVLDEADRMFDMGFIDDVEKIIKNCSRERQTLFFSATISSDIKRLAGRHMIDPVVALVTNQVDPSKLKQFYYNVDKNKKLSLLVHLLKKDRSGLAMIFCNTRKITGFVYDALRANGVRAVTIHGGLTQNKRSKTIEMFNDARINVLVCTDVAARGLHIDDVSHIFNYDIPKDSKDYVHRIGRTARAGEEGEVFNLLCDYDFDNFSRVIQEYREFSILKLDVPVLQKIDLKFNNNSFSGGNSGRNFKSNNFSGSRFSHGSSGSGLRNSRSSGNRSNFFKKKFRSSDSDEKFNKGFSNKDRFKGVLSSDRRTDFKRNNFKRNNFKRVD